MSWAIPVNVVDNDAASPMAETTRGDPADPLDSEALAREVERLRASEAQLTFEFANYRRRTEAQLAAVAREARLELLGELGDTVAALERAQQAAESDPGAVGEGVKLVARNLQRVFDAHGLRRIAAVGEAFDPTVHDAVLAEHAADVEPGTVLRELSPGFRTDEAVIRPAKVCVAR